MKRKKVRGHVTRTDAIAESQSVDQTIYEIARADVARYEVARESKIAPEHSATTISAIAAIIFVVAHLALMIGLTTPNRIIFDEVHYVPAAKQMLEHGIQKPVLNPMHPPLAKQLMALSILAFGDGPFGWRYPSVLFGSLAIVAMYLCGLALFARQGPAVAAALLTFLNQMVFVQSRIAMLDIYALGFDLLGIAAFMYGFRKTRPHLAFGVAGLAFGLAAACKWSGLFPLGICVVVIGVIRLMQGWRTGFADGDSDDWYRPDIWPDYRYYHFVACFVVIPAAAYFATFVPLYGFAVGEILEAQLRIFSDNAGMYPPHTYMSKWLTWPLLMRPVWYQFDKIADDRVQAIVFLGNPLILWPALVALGICLRDWIVMRRWQAFLILSFYIGPWVVWPVLPRTISFLYYYLPSATVATLALVYALTQSERAEQKWLLWIFVGVASAGFLALLPISMASVGTSMETYVRLMLFRSWI